MTIDLLLNQAPQGGVTRVGDFGESAPFIVMEVGGETAFVQMPITIMSRSTLLWDQRDFTPDSVMGASAIAAVDANSLKDAAGVFGKGFIENITRGMESKIGEAVGLRDAADYVAHRQGKAVNPNKEVTFSGLGYRNFSFEFEIIPTNRDQSNKLNKFIYTMQLYAAPDFAGAGKTYFRYPDLWEIFFEPSNFLPVIMPCYLTDYSINHGGAGKFVTHNGAAPLQVNISMTFTEAELHMRDKIKAGYWG